ncbi:MAG TPA: helicase-associated domain-containing protein [Chthonomonadaceae bacterium]|nr:helicase-associated domain-containing protein [Chthonomonadaceae bacterium]
MASLAEALYALPTERLRTLIKTRDVALSRLSLTPSKRQLVQFLAGEISKANSVVQAIAQCNARELRLLQLILSCDSGSDVAWERVRAMAGGLALEEALSGVMARLEDLGLAFRLPPDKVYLPDPVRPHIPVSLPDRYPLARCLDTYDFPTLKRIYFNLALGKEPGSKPETIEAIRAHLVQDDKGMRLKNPLDAEEIAVLEYLIQNGGWATPADVATAVLQGRTEDFFRYDWQNRWKQGRERNSVDHLLARGILHVVAHGYAFNLYLILPGDLMRALTGDVNTAFWTRPLDTPAPLPVPPASMTRHTGLIRDVVSLFAFLAHQEAVRTNTGHIHKSSLKNLARALSLPDERYAGFLYAVCREAKLIAPEGEKQAYTLTERGESWFHADATTQIRALFEGWRAGDVWAEMYNDPLQKVGDYRPRENILRMRHALLGLLSSCPAENAYDLSALADVLAFRHPLMLAQSATMGPDLVASPALFVKRLVGECLAYLGLVELGRGEAKAAGSVSAEVPAARKAALGVERGKPARKPPEPEVTAFRLTPLGAHLLGVAGAEAPAEEPRESKVIVQANAEIFLPPYLEPHTLYQLLQLAELPTKGGTSHTVRLTRESIRSALDNGLSARELLSFLQTCARTGIPQNIEYLIREVADRHGHIHIGRAQMYMQVDSPLLLQELQARKEFKPYFVRALSDTVALLQGEDTDKLLRELRKAGYLPVSDDPPAPSVRKADVGASFPLSQLRANAPTQKRRMDEAEDVLDWSRIAKEDGKPFHVPAPAAKPARAVENVVEETTPAPANVVRDRTQIGVLLAQAAQGRKCVEIAYKRMNDVLATRRVIEPRVVIGDFVSAFCRESQSYDSFNIKRMQWARLTGQAFEEG